MENVYPLDLFEKYFSAFSGHMLEYKGVLYTTLEHAYHCQRYGDLKIIEEIKAARSALKAWEISQKYKTLQAPDWDEQKRSVMEELSRAKRVQHDDVKKALVESGDMQIVKHQADPFWGDNIDGTGRNELGKVWMKLRDELRSGTTAA